MRVISRYTSLSGGLRLRDHNIYNSGVRWEGKGNGRRRLGCVVNKDIHWMGRRRRECPKICESGRRASNGAGARDTRGVGGLAAKAQISQGDQVCFWRRRCEGGMIGGRRRGLGARDTIGSRRSCKRRRRAGVGDVPASGAGWRRRYGDSEATKSTSRTGRRAGGWADGRQRGCHKIYKLAGFLDAVTEPETQGEEASGRRRSGQRCRGLGNNGTAARKREDIPVGGTAGRCRRGCRETRAVGLAGGNRAVMWWTKDKPGRRAAG